MEVSLHVDSSLVEILVLVSGVSFKLMSINKVINEFQHFFLLAVQAYSTWINIEWEVVVSLNVHEVVIEVEHWVEERALLNVTC